MTDDLIGLMAKHHISRKEMARRMGVTPKTFALKLKRGIFGSDEIEVMMKTLDIRDPLSIFLRMWSLIKRQRRRPNIEQQASNFQQCRFR